MLVSPTQRVAAEKEALQPAFNLSDIGTIQDHLVTNDERIMYNCSAVSRRGRSRSSPVGITAGSSMEAPKLPAENSTLDPKEDALENYKTYTDHTKNDPQPQPEAKKKNEDAVKAVEHMQPPPQYSQETNVSSQTVKQLRVEAAEDRSDDEAGRMIFISREAAEDRSTKEAPPPVLVEKKTEAELLEDGLPWCQ